MTFPESRGWKDAAHSREPKSKKAETYRPGWDTGVRLYPYHPYTTELGSVRLSTCCENNRVETGRTAQPFGDCCLSWSVCSCGLSSWGKGFPLNTWSSLWKRTCIVQSSFGCMCVGVHKCVWMCYMDVMRIGLGIRWNLRSGLWAIFPAPPWVFDHPTIILNCGPQTTSDSFAKELGRNASSQALPGPS